MMEQDVLRRVQLVQLEIAKEIKRVCDENGIHYFLDAGTLIGAVRHQGFIPWDDDLDIGMLREDYDKFVKIAPTALKPEYIWQDWNNDEHYAVPFGKVRKKNTVYQEEKSSRLKNNGFYVDIFPFDYAPDSKEERDHLQKQCVFEARCLLVKEDYKPWQEAGKINWKKRIGYLPYQVCSLFMTHQSIVQKYEKIVRSVPKADWIYEHAGYYNDHYFRLEWMKELKKARFEDDEFLIPAGTDERLREEYGDYMTPPPEDQRENRHGIVEIRF